MRAEGDFVAIYLNEMEFGNDAACVGFPHLLLCMGVLALTANDMYGAHLDSVGGVSDTVITEVGNLMTQNAVTAIKALYGCCNRKVRYNSSNLTDDWKNEMKAIAKLLNYTGKVYGFDTEVIDPKQGTYVEYHPDYNKDQCAVYYKRDEKMTYTKGNAPATVQRVNQYSLNVVPVKSNMATTGASIVATPSNHGKLHEVNYFLRMTEITV